MSTHARMHAIALLASACTAAVIAPSNVSARGFERVDPEPIARALRRS